MMVRVCEVIIYTYMEMCVKERKVYVNEEIKGERVYNSWRR